MNPETNLDKLMEDIRESATAWLDEQGVPPESERLLFAYIRAGLEWRLGEVIADA